MYDSYARLSIGASHLPISSRKLSHWRVSALRLRRQDSAGSAGNAMANLSKCAGVLWGAILAIAGAVSGAYGQASAPDPSLVTRGAYLAKAADCMPCHTSAKDKQFAGGLKLDTPFGAMFSPNITPDPDTGIGRWTYEDFKNALHAGIRADGSYLYPVMTYDAFTLIHEDDLKALR